MDDPPSSEVQMFGKKVPQKAERKFMLIAGAIGIVGVILVVLKNRASGAVPTSGAGANQPSASGGSAGTSGAAGGGAITTSTPAAPPTPPLSVELKFSESTSPSTTYQTTKGSSKSASGGLSLFGVTLGGGSGGASQSGQQVQQSFANEFSADTIITGGTAADVAAAEAWLTGLAGTQQQRADQATLESQQAYPYVAAGHSVAGDSMAAINQQTSAQALSDAKNQEAINKINHTGTAVFGRSGGPIQVQVLGRSGGLTPIGVAK